MTAQKSEPTSLTVTLLHDFLFDAYHKSPDRVAIVCQGQHFTYKYVHERSNALAYWLRSKGVHRNDRVMIIGERSIEVVLAFWGTLKAEGVAVLLSPTTKEFRFFEVFDDCKPTTVVADSRFMNFLHNHSERADLLTTPTLFFPQPGLPIRNNISEWSTILTTPTLQPITRTAIDIDLATLVYTSGSTGKAKGVMLTHRNMITAAQSVAEYLHMNSEDIILLSLPFAFDYGLYQAILCTVTKATLVIAPEDAMVTDLLQLMNDEQVTGWPGVPSQFIQIQPNEIFDKSHYPKLRFLTSTAAILPQSTISNLRHAFPNSKIFSMYGLTECHRCTYLPPSDIEFKPTSIGIAIPNTELWLITSDGNECRRDGEGELVIRGATVMAGYWGKPKETSERLKPGPIGTEHILYTGDWCRLDSEGYLYFLGRMDDVFKSGGVKVVPVEIERVLLMIPYVIEAAVIPVAHPILGMAAKAFVVTDQKKQLTSAHIRRECRRYLDSSSVPHVIELLDQLPKTINGKIDKTALLIRSE